MRNLVILLYLICCSSQLLAQQVISFGDERQLELEFEFEFVDIGDPGNLDDPFAASGYSLEQQTVPMVLPSGGVDYTFGISKFQVSLEQFQVADSEIGIGYSLETALNTFIRNGVENVPRPAMPASVSWNEAARFVNWLNVISGYEPAYSYEFQPGDEEYVNGGRIRLLAPEDQGYNPENQYRNGMARFALPTLDEWHKAAFYDPAKDGDGYWEYSSATDEPATPVASGTDPGTAVYSQPRTQGPPDVTEGGGPSAYGVIGMGQGMQEILEDPWDGVKDTVRKDRNVRGFYWFVDDQFAASNFTEAIGSNDHIAFSFRVVDLGEIPAGDFNGDRVFTPRDIDELVDAINSPEPSDFYDLNGDGSVNADDRTFWIEELANVTYGDADMNGEVDFGDFLALSGAFETDGGWSGGDFDGSGLTDFVDFLTLSGNFGQTVTAVASVPEPSSVALATLSLLALGVLLRQRR